MLTSEDLQARQAAAVADDTVRGLFFRGCYSSVLQHCGERPFAELLRKWDGDVLSDFRSYPVRDFLGVLWDAAQALGPVLGDSALRELGAQAAKDFFASTLGRSLLVLVGNDPKRFFAHMPTAYHSAVSYGERTVQWRGAKTVKVCFRRDFLPAGYHSGVFTAALRAIGVANVTCLATQRALLDADFELAWE